MDRRSLLAVPFALLGERRADMRQGSRLAMRQQSFDVPMLGGNPARTGEHPGPGPEGRPAVRWRFATGDRVMAAPAVAGGVVYAGSLDGMAYALDAGSGEERWRFPSGDGVVTTPAVVAGVVYLTWTETLVALDAATGAERWYAFTAGPVGGSPAVVDGAVYVTGDTRLYVVGAADGEERWTLDLDEVTFSSSPAVADGALYVGTYLPDIDRAACRAFDLATRAERWRFETDGFFDATADVAGGTVYLGAWDGHLYALDAATGGERWRVPIGTREISTPAFAAGTVYVSADRTLYGMDATTGAVRWRLPGAGGPPVVAGGVVYAGPWEGPLFAVDAATGAERWRLDIGGATSSPVVTGGFVFVGSRDGGVYAVGSL